MMENKKGKILIVMVCMVMLTTVFAIVPGSLSAATTRTVDDDGPADFLTIQEAIDAASSGDTIQVATGTYYENINFNGKAISVESESGSNSTVIDGSNSCSVVTFNSGEDFSSVLNGFTIQNGNALYGGGIYCDHSSPTITNNIISSNSAIGDGGGIESYYSSPTILSNIITGNFAGYAGGGIFVFHSQAIIKDNILTGNFAPMGGGIGCSVSQPPITNNTIKNNSASMHGGGIDLWICTTCITNNLIIDNSAGNGGGIYWYYCQPSITSNTMVGNAASDHGGGLFGYVFPTNPKIANNIIALSADGEGIYCADAGITPAYPPTILYNDIWGNADGEYGGSCYIGEGNILADPLLASDYHIGAGSPCIDAGDNSEVLGWCSMTTDFEGDPRIWDGDGDGVAVVDMGADEYYVRMLSATIDIDPDTLNLESKGKWITCYIELPESYDVADIDVSTILIEDTISAETNPTEIGDYDDDGIADLMVKFDRSAVQKILGVGEEVEIIVTGELTDGTPFKGTDTIRVIDKGNGK